MNDAKFHQVGEGAFGSNYMKSKPSDPDYRGRFLLEGEIYFVSAWLKLRKDDGRPFYSFTISKADSSYVPPAKKKEQPVRGDSGDPF